jgi:Tetratricopeptide repeat
MINFLRPVGIALALGVMLLNAGAVDAAGNPVVVAFEEESIPAADLASPSAAASPSPADDSNPESGTWEKVPTSVSAPGAQASPGGFKAVSAVPPSSPAVPQAAASVDIPPAMDIGSLTPTPQISDSSLEPLINAAPTPARAASLRITEDQRVELERGHVDDAVRELEHAVSIDPSNSYAYFYLGRAYIARKGYAQALTFFKRAEIGLASNSAWLGEIYAFEGLSLEESGKSTEAEAAYQKALAATPGNLTARVGATRLAAFAPAPPAGAPVADAAQPAPDADDAAQPAPDEDEAPPAPNEAPPPPAPASAPSSAQMNRD